MKKPHAALGRPVGGRWVTVLAVTRSLAYGAVMEGQWRSRRLGQMLGESSYPWPHAAAMARIEQGVHDEGDLRREEVGDARRTSVWEGVEAVRDTCVAAWDLASF